MRVTGGTYRSRTLRSPRGTTTRPTSDRVREALFNILESAGIVQDARVLDLYAGTGALALEALSRGASRAVLVESSPGALAALRANITSLGVAERTLVLAGPTERLLRRLVDEGPFELILADPPWALIDSGDAPRAIEELCRSQAFSPNAVVVLEHAARSEPPAIGGLTLQERRRYGDTALAMYKPAILAPSRLTRARTTCE